MKENDVVIQEMQEGLIAAVKAALLPELQELKTGLAAVQFKVGSLENQIGELRVELRTEVGALRNGMNELKAQMELTRREISFHDRRLTHLEHTESGAEGLSRGRPRRAAKDRARETNQQIADEIRAQAQLILSELEKLQKSKTNGK